MSEREQQIESWLDRPVVGSSGEPIGTLLEVFLDEETGEPRWALLDAPERPEDPPFAPMAGLREEGPGLRLDITRHAVLDSPRLRAREGHLEPYQEEKLAHHYAGGGTVDPEAETRVQPVVPDPAVADGPGDLPEVVRSEEELAVSTVAVPAERVRLVKRIVTETVTRTIEVRREELQIERVPVERGEGEIASAPAAGADFGEPFADFEQEIVLMEEDVVLTKRIVPRERVRLVKGAVVEEREVSEQLAREQVTLEHDGLRPSGTTD